MTFIPFFISYVVFLGPSQSAQLQACFLKLRILWRTCNLWYRSYYIMLYYIILYYIILYCHSQIYASKLQHHIIAALFYPLRFRRWIFFHLDYSIYFINPRTLAGIESLITKGKLPFTLSHKHGDHEVLEWIVSATVRQLNTTLGKLYCGALIFTHVNIGWHMTRIWKQLGQ